MNNALVDRIDAIDGLQTAYDVFHFTRDLGLQFGADRFAIVALDDRCTSMAKLAMLNNWEPSLLRAYDDKNLANSSPILEHMRVGIRPLRYNMTKLSGYQCARDAATAAALFHDFGMAQGICNPVGDRTGRRGGIAFSGTQIGISTEDTFALHLLCNYLFERLMTFTNYHSEWRRPAALTARETDCLRWAAFGKTTKETALLLDATDNTVAHHLASACRKLNAANRVHAVATALRLGHLD